LQEPTLTIRDLLQGNWSLTGDLAAGNIDFSMGVPLELRSFPSIEVRRLIATKRLLNLGSTPKWLVEERVTVDIWLRLGSPDKTSLEALAGLRRSALDEVLRILHANGTGLTGISFQWPSGEAARDELEPGKTGFAVLRSQLEVRCLYFHTG